MAKPDTEMISRILLLGQ